MLREAGKRIGDLLATRLIASKAFEGFQRQFAGCQSARLVEGDHVDACKCLDGRTARKRRPRRAPQAIAESTRAHGEATTRSVLARQNALARPPSGRNEDRKPTTRGKTSQNRERGSPRCMSSQIDYEPLGWGPHSLGFADEADDFFAMRSRSPCVARASMAPQRFIVSESRMSPGSLEIGRDSPVRFDSSHAVAP